MKLYADEHGHESIRDLETIVVSVLARVEVPAALWRKARTGELAEGTAGILVSAFEVDFHGGPTTSARFTIVALPELVLLEAAKAAAQHGLRAYDAVQLASGLAVRGADPRCAGFACFDTELRRAASRAGFAVLPSDL